MNLKTHVFAIVALTIGTVTISAQSNGEIVAVNKNTPTKEPVKTTAKPASDKDEWTKTWSVLVGFNSVFNSNLEHDPIGVRAFGFTPSITTGYQVRSKRHRARFIYGFAGTRYTRSTDLNRIGQYFGASYRFTLGRWSSETEAEAIFKGTNDDRETNNQFIGTQKLSFRFDDKTRAQVYYAYRVKRFIPEDAERNSVNPMYGFKFSREFGKKADWEVGYRYDENRAQSPRQSYIRSTYDTEFKYQLTKKDILEAGFAYKPRLYSRTLRVGDVRVPRRDRKYTWELNWQRSLTDRLSFDLGYAFERQTSNDPEKPYKDHQISFSLVYHWGNGDVIKP